MSKEKDKPPTQWHPLFAELLRPLLQDYYEVQTNVAVSDKPREADILLLRRTNDGPAPFSGLWRHLTTWNVLEFKGPTVDARIADLHLVVELGFGIFRRLNKERRRSRDALLKPECASFWYVAKSLGGRFLSVARRRLGQLEEIETGLWRSQILQHLVFLVSSETFASEPESVPLHLLLKRSPVRERELAHLVLEQPHYLEWYGQWLSLLHPEVWTEVRGMSRRKDLIPKIDYSAVAEDVDMEKMIAAYGVDRIIEIVGAKKFIKHIGADQLLKHMPPDELKKLKERLK